MKMLEISCCAECKHYPYSGWAADMVCGITGEILTGSIEPGMLSEDEIKNPVDVMNNVGKECPLMTVVTLDDLRKKYGDTL